MFIPDILLGFLFGFVGGIWLFKKLIESPKYQRGEGIFRFFRRRK